MVVRTRRRTVRLVFVLLMIGVSATLDVLSRLREVDTLWPSPSGRRVAVVETSYLSSICPAFRDLCAAHSKLYFYRCGKEKARQFVGNLLNTRIDRLAFVKWNDDESEIAIGNTYDTTGVVTVVIDLRDRSGRVYEPKATSHEYGTDDLRNIVDTKYSIRMAEPNWPRR